MVNHSCDSDDVTVPEETIWKDQKLGILIGCAVGLTCIIVCVIVIMCRNRWVNIRP